jgi:hypothetical protein
MAERGPLEALHECSSTIPTYDASWHAHPPDRVCVYRPDHAGREGDQQPEQPSPADFANNSSDLGSGDGPDYCRTEDLLQPDRQSAAKPLKKNGSGDLRDLGCFTSRYSETGGRREAANGSSPPPNPWRGRI